ncbi:MAG: alpha/beta hydrolase [Thioclava marina]|jgi:Predicted hydrolases or acyltransferases (alpha/beta hydrolase superfamily)|uniref:Alpha/beta hydrolase n=1 Tax=Thioclava marina TaxID=1915077 RepID=A0ABX3MN22_9RHOB|nr:MULTISPECIES: alpha/beta hydrolase [Thioclava]MBD3788531.1 alpha/beta hydrolase [Sphingomonadales bacterium]TNE83492.1 MAG: alpha/beta hydrolase [Paracoccaceae bacterium]MBC7144725.1 alpha/beta hydrolase [Thioclava marina]MBD3803723.1 alpha/beta hydrolase [Thioclava sp.]OOY11569.1 alpha/beta hydrolase [Thioclava marina]
MPNDPLVFLPGFMCDARLFWHQLQDLSSERSVMVARLRGSTIEEMAQAVLADAPTRFALAGHWLGGVVAIEILRRAPERVSQLALIDVSPLPETPQVAASRETRIVGARTGRLDEMMLDEIPSDSLAPGAGRATVQALMLEMAAALGPDAFERQSRALMRRPDLQRTLRNTKTRALLMCGEYDRICPPRRHEFLAELMPHAEYRLILGAGHMSPLEQPEKITQGLRDWLGAPLLLA